jgi:hypothetical protein
MTPETIVSLIQLGATGLLAIVIWFGQEQMKAQMTLITTLIVQQQQMMNKLIDNAIKDEVRQAIANGAASQQR